MERSTKSQSATTLKPFSSFASFFEESPEAAALTDFAWQVLPMGWTWSPFICQVLAWIPILHVAPREGFLQGRHQELERPSKVRVGLQMESVSCLCCTTTSFFYCADPKVADQFAERLRQNYSFFNTRPRFLDVIQPDSILIGPDDKVPTSTVYRGVEIGQRQVQAGVHKTCARVE